MKNVVTISPKYQIVIPQEIRERLKLKPGQQMTFMEYNGMLTITPVLDMTQARGFLKGQDIQVDRDKQ
ncbi:MAG: AbrB/MazE/SpoVT family DNA-binding domain-containing protein [bacterium]|nr:AbrB/MazE/SpoVT family DNA-binding domain-containing protein [bacterium]